MKNDCSDIAATATSCALWDKPGFVLRTTLREAKEGVPQQKVRFE